MDQGLCPACGQRSESWDVPSRDWQQFQCPVCGDFTATWELVHCPAYDRSNIGKKLSRRLYETRSVGERLVHTEKIPGYDGAYGPLIVLSEIERMYTDDGSPLDKYENTIRSIAMSTSTFGQEFDCETDRWLIPTMDDGEADQIVLALVQDGYLTEERAFSLTPEGLKYAAELGRHAKAQGTAVFIAACFNDDLAEAREALRSTISELGYQPKQVNREPHNNLIDLEIFRLIRESKFVVADLTCNRQSVYYEVGFAHGLGLEVVLTCREDHLSDNKKTKNDFNRVHFDLNHRNILTWNNCAELEDKLRGHIYQSFGALTPGFSEDAA